METFYIFLRTVCRVDKHCTGLGLFGSAQKQPYTWFGHMNGVAKAGFLEGWVGIDGWAIKGADGLVIGNKGISTEGTLVGLCRRMGW